MQILHQDISEDYVQSTFDTVPYHPRRYLNGKKKKSSFCLRDIRRPFTYRIIAERMCDKWEDKERKMSNVIRWSRHFSSILQDPIPKNRILLRNLIVFFSSIFTRSPENPANSRYRIIRCGRFEIICREKKSDFTLEIVVFLTRLNVPLPIRTPLSKCSWEAVEENRDGSFCLLNFLRMKRKILHRMMFVNERRDLHVNVIAFFKFESSTNETE